MILFKAYVVELFTRKRLQNEAIKEGGEEMHPVNHPFPPYLLPYNFSLFISVSLGKSVQGSKKKIFFFAEHHVHQLKKTLTGPE